MLYLTCLGIVQYMYEGSRWGMRISCGESLQRKWSGGMIG